MTTVTRNRVGALPEGIPPYIEDKRQLVLFGKRLGER
jgi:hypothetical protein